VPAEEHDDASADDIEPGLVLPRNLAESPTSRAPPLLHHHLYDRNPPSGLGKLAAGEGMEEETMREWHAWIACGN